MNLIDNFTSHKHWKRSLAIALIVLTILTYFARWLLFGDPDHRSEIGRYFLDNVAFMFFSIFVVTLVLETYLERRQRESMRKKLNMIIGAFFSEVGYDLLRLISAMDSNAPTLLKSASPQMRWKHEEFEQSQSALDAYVPDITPTPQALEHLKALLEQHKTSMLSMLTNQALLDDESFADLLWAVSHLGDELAARNELTGLPASDYRHLAFDARRAYLPLAHEWLNYLEHLSVNYPYLYSLSVRNNPLDSDCSVIVTEDAPKSE